MFLQAGEALKTDRAKPASWIARHILFGNDILIQRKGLETEVRLHILNRLTRNPDAPMDRWQLGRHYDYMRGQICVYDDPVVRRATRALEAAKLIYVVPGHGYLLTARGRNLLGMS